MSRVHLAVWLALVMVVGAGCGASKTVVDEQGNRTTMTDKAGGVEVTFEGKKGEKVRIAGGEGGVPLPDGFPKDVPVYPNSTPVVASTTGDVTNVVLTTADSAAKTLAFYTEKLAAAGWTTESTLNLPSGSMISSSKSDRTLNVTVVGEDNQTTISLGLGKK